MITYSPQDMQKQLVADQRLWRRVPPAAAAILWPAEIAVLGWNTGSWTGVLTVAAIAILTVVAPSRLPINIYLVDILERLLRLPLFLVWLLLVWHLAVREPLFPILGLPLAGAAVATLLAWLAARVLSTAFRIIAQRTLPRRSAGGA